jgi:hypothetical protein
MSAVAFVLSFIGSCLGILSNCSIIVLVILTKQVSSQVQLCKGRPSFLIHHEEFDSSVTKQVSNRFERRMKLLKTESQVMKGFDARCNTET